VIVACVCVCARMRQDINRVDFLLWLDFVVGYVGDEDEFDDDDDYDT
jgi:hypothetical protein